MLLRQIAAFLPHKYPLATGQEVQVREWRLLRPSARRCLFAPARPHQSGYPCTMRSGHSLRRLQARGTRVSRKDWYLSHHLVCPVRQREDRSHRRSCLLSEAGADVRLPDGQGRLELQEIRPDAEPWSGATLRISAVHCPGVSRGGVCTVAFSVPLQHALRSMIAGQSNRQSGKVSFMHKVLSPVIDFCLDYELLQYQYDWWLFKTIAGAINSSKASGCSPNAALQQNSFSPTYWEWQHLYLLDAVRQYGYPSFFLTISPYEWTFPWLRFIQQIREDHCLEPTDLPLLETLHVGQVLEQIARGYLTGANSNRWHQHVFNNQDQLTESNVLTYFYRMEFQSRGTLHMHMLVWVKDLSLIRANLLHASIPWANANDAFLVADTSCLPLSQAPDSFVGTADGRTHLQFHYTPEDTSRNLHAYVRTLLGALRCRTDVQLADGKGMLLKYVSSYVTKMHKAAMVEGLYCTDVTGFQVANSFLRTVQPLAPEMAFQLSNIKVAWTDKQTKQFRAPHPGQEDGNQVYQQYLKRHRSEDHQSLLEWLR